MSHQTIPEDKIKERIMILKRFLYPLEWDWPNEVRTRISQEVFNGQLPIDKPVDIQELAKTITDEQLEKMIHISPRKDHFCFRGKYYTILKGGKFEPKGSWEEVKAEVRNVLKIHGKKAYALLKALIEMSPGHFMAIAMRASEIYGERLYPIHLMAELKERDLVWKIGDREWVMPGEIVPAVTEVLSEIESRPLPKLSTKQAEREFLEVIKMEEEFKTYLEDLLETRLDETIKFGRNFSPIFLMNYLQELFGPVIFFDHLLTITQQYSISNTDHK